MLNFGESQSSLARLAARAALAMRDASGMRRPGRSVTMRPGTNSRNDVEIRETLLARSSNLGEIDAGFAESDVAGFSARARVAHDKGTKNARRCLATMILALVAIGFLRPMYGPYIDRFGDGGDITNFFSKVESVVEERIQRYGLKVQQRTWGSSRGWRGHGNGFREGDG